MEKKLIKTVKHLFMPGHTIIGALKLHNNFNISQDEINFLIDQFIILNGLKVIKAGEYAEIPVLIK